MDQGDTMKTKLQKIQNISARSFFMTRNYRKKAENINLNNNMY